VLTVGKPTRTARSFTEGSRRKLFLAGWIVFSCVILVVVLVSARVTGPLRALTEYARAVRDGRRVETPRRGSAEVRELSVAFEQMRDALEGKRYVERYVQTLTHEIKSPLSAIRGAVELLGEEMPPEQRARFIDNARTESSRIQALIEKLLLLSALESRKGLEALERMDLREIVDQAAGSLLPILERRQLRFEIEGNESCPLLGDRFQVRQAVENLLQNAIDFSPDGAPIVAALSRTTDGFAELKILDRGVGVPAFALGKVFDRFYSLARPRTGRKSSGLGLSLVKEVALLHRGAAELRNREGGGACAILRLPTALG
jgi:two-component system sensor histidine kinase CreC